MAGGTYLARIYPGEADRRRDMRGLPGRVVEYAQDDPNRPEAGERHRLNTGLTNPDDMPANEAPSVCHERREKN